MENNEQMLQLKSLSTDLLQDIRNVRNGELEIKKAREISGLASNAIKCITQSVISVEQQNIQIRKLLMRGTELEFKKDELIYKKSLIKDE